MREIFSRIRWRQHLIGMTAFIASVVTITFAIIFTIHTSNEWEIAKYDMKQQQSLNNYAESQLQIFNKNFPDFEKLQNEGFVGNKKRLQWLETLSTVGERYNIPGVNFTLENAKPAEELKDHYFHHSLKLEITQMKLILHLIHEGDWFHLVQFLRTNAQGIFSAEQCELNRQSSGLKETYLEMLVGSCEFEWYTIVDFSEEWDNE